MLLDARIIGDKGGGNAKGSLSEQVKGAGASRSPVTLVWLTWTPVR